MEKPIKKDTPEGLLDSLREEINLLNEGEFKKALEDLEKKLSQEIQAQVDNQNIMETDAVACVRETISLIETVVKGSSSKQDKMDVIQLYEDQFCKTSILGNFVRAAAFVVITALGTLLGATIGALVGMIAGAWTGPGAAASAVLGLAKGAIDGAAVGVVVAGAVTGISSAALGGHLLFKPEKTKVVVKKAKEFSSAKEDEDSVYSNSIYNSI